MKKLFTVVLIILSTATFSQNTDNDTADKYAAHNKGKFYIYWGGNRDTFTKSDIHFSGADYDFTLYDVTARDKPKGWHVDYVNPGRMTIPQTNFRMGYYISDKYNIGLGVDHMKYVMNQDVAVKYSGSYSNYNPGSFGETLPNGEVLLTEDFLTFEHTDGLNYINADFNRVDDLSKYFHLPNIDKFQINITEGIGGGILFPKTNAKLFNKERHDDFHVSGYGFSAKAGLNFTFYKYFFIQTEVKGGYINMPDIRTTFDAADKASQHFWFFQKIITVGGVFRI
jgi:hypothetical protein